MNRTGTGLFTRTFGPSTSTRMQERDSRVERGADCRAHRRFVGLAPQSQSGGTQADFAEGGRVDPALVHGGSPLRSAAGRA
jgi:hypothetical protein